MAQSKVVAEQHHVSYTRHLEGRSGTWTTRNTLFEGTYEECYQWLQENTHPEDESWDLSFRIIGKPPVYGPKPDPKAHSDELPF